VTRKDKKQDKPASRRPSAAQSSDKKRKGKGKGKAKRRAEVAEARALRPRSEAPNPRGSKGKAKKRRRQSATENAPPLAAATAAVTGGIAMSEAHTKSWTKFIVIQIRPV